MKNFGFSVKQTRVIDVDTFDDSLLKYVLANESSFMCCMYCGSCTATCSTGNLIDFNVRKINLFLRRGQYDMLANEIDKCMFCGKCTLVCPRDINLRNTIMLIKKGIVEHKNGKK